MNKLCTGIAANWCPNCGDCICRPEDDPEAPLDHPNCPLHSVESRHAETNVNDLYRVLLEIEAARQLIPAEDRDIQKALEGAAAIIRKVVGAQLAATPGEGEG